MRTFPRKHNQPQQRVSTNLASSNARTSKPTHHIHPLLHLQRTNGNQAVQRLLARGSAHIAPQADGTESTATRSALAPSLIVQRQESESLLPAEPTEPTQLGSVELDLDPQIGEGHDTTTFHIPVTRSHLIVSFQGTALRPHLPACRTVDIELFRGGTSMGWRTFRVDGNPHTRDYTGVIIVPGMYHFTFRTNGDFCHVNNPRLTARW